MYFTLKLYMLFRHFVSIHKNGTFFFCKNCFLVTHKWKVFIFTFPKQSTFSFFFVIFHRSQDFYSSTFVGCFELSFPKYEQNLKLRYKVFSTEDHWHQFNTNRGPQFGRSEEGNFIQCKAAAQLWYSRPGGGSVAKKARVRPLSG